ncbi:MAG TPA: MopE-related protein, partial [Myxococcota bacterium]|nr:MopE-related protein [Myxococcota bacterium]
MPRTLLACLALTSCTWVTPGEVLDKLQWLDDDDDGVPNGEDCAPASASEGGAAEVPYDGLDNDCADGDALDLDGDGWPGVDQATWEARRDAAGGSGDWPVTLGARVDCDDTDPAVRPDATEIFYDGARTRCDTAHDFDADGDGWISDAWDGTPELAAWDAAWPDAPGEPGDCDDADDRVHPGADDPPYDGKDADCGYDNDFDADGDGYVADGDGLWAAFLVYRSRPGYGEVPGEPGDCLDVDRPFDGAVAIDLPNICSSTEPTLRAGAVQAHLVHPGACDLRQDGVDADCAGDDDFDFDEDGWYPDALAEDRARYAAAWGYTLTDPGGDCDDDDREIHPGAEEAIGDAVDQDCDGGPYGASTTPIHWLDGSYTT